jgi:nicotinate-nucleotide adenylyltransferase
VIGILGGTFDPPHIGHLAIAHAALDQMSLSKVLIMPAGDPWQKSERDVTTAADRLAMVALAAAEAAEFDADDREMRREGPTFTIDTVASLAEDAVIILGADAAVGVGGWHLGDELIAAARFAVIPRTGIERSQVSEVLGDRFVWVDLPLIDISSSEIRSHVAAGHSPRFLVPESVAEYIGTRDLYRSTPLSGDRPVPIIALNE